MNKKKWIMILAVLTVLAVVFAGCGKKEPQAEAAKPTDSQVQTDAPEMPEVKEETEAATETPAASETDPYDDGDIELTPPTTEKPAEATEPEEKPEPTKPGTTQQPTEPQPTIGGSTGTQEVPTIAGSSYESYIAMSGEQQEAFINQFDSVAEFVQWYNAAKAEYDAAHPDIEIGGDTVIDGSQLGKN